jgi:hypothetical protein
MTADRIAGRENHDRLVNLGAAITVNRKGSTKGSTPLDLLTCYCVSPRVCVSPSGANPLVSPRRLL